MQNSFYIRDAEEKMTIRVYKCDCYNGGVSAINGGILARNWEAISLDISFISIGEEAQRFKTNS